MRGFGCKYALTPDFEAHVPCDIISSCEAPRLAADWAPPLLSEWKDTLHGNVLPTCDSADLIAETTGPEVNGI